MKFLILVLLIIIDFISKKIIFNYIDLYNKISVFNFFDITHIRNYGISFGLFADILPLWVILFLGITMTVFLFFWMLKRSNNIEKWGILLILTGAISNISDRAMNNYVMDFISFHYKQYYWPAFNFADIYISLGVMLIIIQSVLVVKTKFKEKDV